MKSTLTISPFLLILPLFGLVFCISWLFYTCNDEITLSIYLLIAGLLSSQLKKYIISTRYKIIVLLGVSIVFILVILIYLVLLGQARRSTPDSYIRNSISSLRVHAEIESVKNGSYNNLCQTEAVVNARKTYETLFSTSQNKCLGPLLKYFFPIKESLRTLQCNAAEKQYAIEAKLLNSPTFVCVDSTGLFKYDSIVSIGSGTSCQD